MPAPRGEWVRTRRSGRACRTTRATRTRPPRARTSRACTAGTGNELLLKLFFGRQVDREACIRLVRDYRKRMQELLEKYEATERRMRRELAGHPDLAY